MTLDQVAITNSTSSFAGGAIDDEGGNLTIARSRFSGDTATSAMFESLGGAIVCCASGGTLSVSDTEFAVDTASGGGAAAVGGGTTGLFDRVTFDSNSASADGGAVEAEGSATIYNATFIGNSAPIGGALAVLGVSATAVNDTFDGNAAATGADVFNGGSSFATQNSIFANPQGGGGSCGGTIITDDGNNLEVASPSSRAFTSANSDIVGQSPQLASAPADNGNRVATAGGPPQTLALSTTSPALHATSASGCATVGSVDERSMPRPGSGGHRVRHRRVRASISHPERHRERVRVRQGQRRWHLLPRHLLEHLSGGNDGQPERAAGRHLQLLGLERRLFRAGRLRRHYEHQPRSDGNLHPARNGRR